MSLNHINDVNPVSGRIDGNFRNLTVSGNFGVSGTIDMNGNPIIGLPLVPTDPTEATSKDYVDTRIEATDSLQEAYNVGLPDPAPSIITDGTIKAVKIKTGTVDGDFVFKVIDTTNGTKFAIKGDGSTTTGQIDTVSNKIINLADGVNPNDAVNLSQIPTPASITDLQTKTQNINLTTSPNITDIDGIVNIAGIATGLNINGVSQSAIDVNTTNTGNTFLSTDATKTFVWNNDANGAILSYAEATDDLTAYKPINANAGIVMGTSKITGLGDPTLPQDATTKSYVDHFNQEFSTGFEANGNIPVLSINGGDNTKFDMSAGIIIIVDNSTSPPTVTEVVVSAQTAVTPSFLATNPSSFISIGLAGTIVQKTDKLTPTQRRSEGQIGLVSHVNNTIIDSVVNNPQIVINTLSQLHDLINAIGFFSTSGNQINPIGGTMTIDKSTGSGFSLNENANVDQSNPHQFIMPVDNLVVLNQINQDLSVFILSSTIDPSVYDNAGTQTALSTNNYAQIARVYIFPNNQMVFMWGQEEYATFSEAQDAVGTESFVEPSNISEGALLLTRIVMKKSTASLSNTSDAKFFPSSAVSAGGGNISTFQQVYDVSTIPQILTSLSQGALTIQAGNGDDTLTVLEIKANGGATTNTICGDGSTIIDYTAVASDSHALEIIHDCATNVDTRSLEILYTTGVQPTNTENDCVLISIDSSLATAGSETVGVAVTCVEGSGNCIGLEVAAQIDPLLHLVGSFTNPSVTNLVISWGADIPFASLAGNDLFPSDNDEIEIHDSAVFEEIEFLFDTFASQTIQPTFWYQTVGPVWTQFSGIDSTDGFRANGAIVWNASLTPSQVTDGGLYKIKIIRTRNNVTTNPVANTIKVAAINEYGWDKNADLSINSMVVTSDISDVGNTNTVDFSTANELTLEGGTSSIIIQNTAIRMDTTLVMGGSAITGTTNILPNTDTVGSIGSATKQYQDLHLSGQVLVAGEDTVPVVTSRGASGQYIVGGGGTSATSSWNCAYGAGAGGGLIGGSSNILMGTTAGLDITSGSSNVCLGHDAGHSLATMLTSGGKNICLGRKATVDDNSSSNISIGYESGVTGSFAVALGENASATGLRTNSIGANTTNTTVNSTVIGNTSHTNIRSNSTTCNLGTTTNKFQNLYMSDTLRFQDQNISIGTTSNNFNGASTTGVENIAIGENAANDLLGGTNNILIGKESGSFGSPTLLTTGSNNICIGQLANIDDNSSDNVCIGYNAGGNGAGSVSIGTGATSGGTTSVAIGKNASTLGDNYSIALGVGASTTAVNQMMLGSASATTTVKSVVPGVTATCDLGSTTKKFQDLYVSKNINLGVITQAASTDKVKGTLIYNTTTDELNYWNGSIWEILAVV